MQKIIEFLEGLSKKIGGLISWIAVLLALVIGVDVVIRYIFQFSYVWITEIEIYLFGMLFLLASGYTFAYGKHVRVDVFYAKFSPKIKAWIDLIGGICFLIPWCYVVIVSSWYYAQASFLMDEGSPQPGGLPAIYILKFCLSLGFSLLLLQGITEILKSIQTLTHKS